jgi:hypothetical protein
MYAEISNSQQLIVYPYNYDTLCEDNPYTNFPSNTDLLTLYSGTTANLNGDTLVEVVIAPQPAYDVAHQNCTQNENPTLVNGVWTLGWTVTDFTPEQQAAYYANVAQQNKTNATSLLQQTDWTCTVDITNPQYSNPYLMNQDAFLAYRSTVRAIAVNPPITPAVFPIMPQEVWSS